MRRSFGAFLAAAVLLAACASKSPSIGPGDTPVNDLTPLPSPADYLPQPGDNALKRGPVFLDTTDLLTLESFPLQFSLSLKGSLPTPCHKLRVQVGSPEAGGILPVEVYSLADPAALCTQVLQPFEVTMPLGSFPAGHYRLLVNGEQTAEFDA
ncbi:MAG: hypothetical protein ACM3QS_03465 [Bacteroidota bacterium]